VIRPAAEHERLLTMYRQRVDGYPDMPAGYPDKWRRWCGMLLARGGDLVVPHRNPDADLDELVAAATDFPTPARSIGGDDGACHRNAAEVWARGEVPAIGTGYALSPDGLWRQHSWAVDGDGTVLETTSAERLAYVGVRLDSGEPVLRFALGNAPDTVKSLLATPTERGRQIIAMLQAARRERAGQT
jgi:hypothetical protein